MSQGIHIEHGADSRHMRKSHLLKSIKTIGYSQLHLGRVSIDMIQPGETSPSFMHFHKPVARSDSYILWSSPTDFFYLSFHVIA